MHDIAHDLQEYIRLRSWFPEGTEETAYVVLACYVLLAVGVRLSEREREEEDSPFLFRAVPYLYFLGAPDSGKSETGDLIVGLSEGKSSVSIPKAVLFRWLNKYVGRLLFIDEASSLYKQDYLDILNAGYKVGGKVPRCEPGSLEPTWFRVFGPKIFAANRALQVGALESRCIPVEFTQCSLAFVPEERDPVQEKAMRRRAREWVRTHVGEVRIAHKKWRACTDNSLFFTPRMREIYSPLFAIAEVAGILEPVREYTMVHQQQRSLRQDMSIGPRLDAVLEGLPDFCRANNVPRGRIPFPTIREFVSQNMNGERVTDKAINKALVGKGYRKLDQRFEDKVCYAAPPSGALAMVWDKMKRPWSA